MTRWSIAGKAIVAVLAAVATAVQAAVSDHRITPLEWVQILIAATTATLVYVIPVVPEWPWAKSAIGGVLAALNVAATLLIGGWSTGAAPEMFLAGLTMLLVRYAPATSTVRPEGVQAD